MANAEAFLKTHEAAAPAGCARRRRGDHDRCRDASARQDRVCRQVRAVPLEQAAARRDRRPTWPAPLRGIASRCSPTTFSKRNFLSDDRRYPVSQLGTNIARAAATNATADNVWAQFSSVTYKNQPAIGRIANLYNPRDPDKPIEFELQGRRPRLLPHADAHLDVGDRAVSAQQRAGHVHQGSLGQRPAARLPGRVREAALAGATAGRAVDRSSPRSTASCAFQTAPGR